MYSVHLCTYDETETTQPHAPDQILTLYVCVCGEVKYRCEYRVGTGVCPSEVEVQE